MGCKHDPSADVSKPPAPKPLPVQTSTNISEADLGLPFYPGSVEKGTSSRAMTTSAARTVICDRTTVDPPKKVAAFYLSKLEHGQSGANSKGMLIGGELKDGAQVTIYAMPSGPGATEIEITVYARIKGSGRTGR